MLLVVIFIVGYLAIAFEHTLRLNKAAAALVTGVLCWTAYMARTDATIVETQLAAHFGGHSQVLFFLLAAMTIVEVIDAHDGFDILTARVTTTNRRGLLVTLSVLAFFLSALLDNLTTAIVMMSLVRRLAADEEDRMVYGGAIVIASNAGGVFSPIGDVTTTMLWVGGQISAMRIVTAVLLPALVSAAVPVAWIARGLRGDVTRPPTSDGGASTKRTTLVERRLVLALGAGVLLCVPVFKAVTGLPPVMGILLGLGVLWAVTEIIHVRKAADEKGALSVSGALQRVDAQSVLFFLGILLAVSALESDGLLRSFAGALSATATGSGRSLDTDLVTLLIGLSSSVVDNVPLVAAAQGMYPLSVFGTDHRFWHFLAYCAGTGGSILIIGSAAGVAVMGLERIRFGWYVRRISLPALLGYAAGAIVFLAIR